MAKKQRRRERGRAAAPAARPAAAHDRPPISGISGTNAAGTTTRRSYAGSARAGSPVRAGASRAIGEPSAMLERAATTERSFVVRDFKRIGIVVAIMVLLLVVSDVAVNALQP